MRFLIERHQNSVSIVTVTILQSLLSSSCPQAEREEVTCPGSQLVSGGARENNFSLGTERLSSWARISVSSPVAMSSVMTFASTQVLPLSVSSSLV